MRDGPHVEVRRRHDVVVEREPPAIGRVVLDHPNQSAVREPGWNPVDDRQPCLRAVLAGDPHRAGPFVHGQGPHAALVSRLHEQRQGPPLSPDDARQVWEGLAVPLDILSRAVQPKDGERHPRVRRPGGRIADDHGLARRIARVRDVPPADRPDVDPCGGDHRPVRRPPEASRPAHLLGGHELRQSPGNVRVVLGPERAVGLLGREAQGTARDVGHAPPGGVDTGVGRAARGVQPAPPAPHEVGDEDAATEGEARHARLAVDRIRDDPPGDLANPFAPSPFLGRKILRRAIEPLGRVTDPALLARRDIEGPQRGLCVVARGRSEEHHARAVPGHVERPRPSEREVPRPGLLAGIARARAISHGGNPTARAAAVSPGGSSDGPGGGCSPGWGPR
jgi:hypothetical protein